MFVLPLSFPSGVMKFRFNNKSEIIWETVDHHGNRGMGMMTLRIGLMTFNSSLTISEYHIDVVRLGARSSLL